MAEDIARTLQLQQYATTCIPAVEVAHTQCQGHWEPVDDIIHHNICNSGVDDCEMINNCFDFANLSL